jgi:hypothetical protein
MNYGTIIDSYDPRNEEIYSMLCEYFGNPMMTKMKDVNGYSMYIAKPKCMLGLHSRYINVMIVQDSSPLGTVSLLDQLKWTSFQTRTRTEKYNLESFNYTPSRRSSNKIVLTERGDRYCKYACEDLPLDVTLILEDWEPKQTAYNYQNSGYIYQALETWKTILTIRE